MFCEEIRIKPGISHISFCPFRILYKSKFIIMATSFGTNAVVVTRVHCIYLMGVLYCFHGIANSVDLDQTAPKGAV